MRPFVYDALPGRVLFGAGRRSQLGDELDRLGLGRVMVIADENAKAVADELVDAVGSRVAARWHEVAQHVPTELAEAARVEARNSRIDGLVSIGGGSTTGLAKAVALVADAPIVAIPTTYAGSEMTPIYGITGEHKQTGRDMRALPRVVLYDPELTTGVPASVTAPSAFNAIAHSVEALYGSTANPVTSLVAEESIRAISSVLPVVVARPDDLEARGDLLYGAYLAGAALAVSEMALHHKICHVLGGSYGLVHGDVNAVVLPHVVAYNAASAPDAIALVARAMSTDDAAGALFDLAVQTGAPTSLSALGMRAGDLEVAATRAAAETSANPADIDARRVLALLDDAWNGRRPSSVDL